ncbi:RTA1 like protein-domain-containing protein [Lactifluus subvellereus]|nr:RTA1 like protein-domain-containing protein [Lactifluus subvellereus]
MSSSNSTSSTQQLQYYYVPTEWVCITFLSLFGISTFVHTVQALYFRLWWLIPSAIFCGFLELAGWSSRLWSSQNPFLRKPVIIQAVTLVIAPTPLVAANFILLGRIIAGSALNTVVWLLGDDIISLLVQGTGGSIAAGSQTSNTRVQLGSDIALGGTVFQLVSIIVYCALAAEFLTRYTWDRPMRSSTHVPGGAFRGIVDIRLRRMLYAMSVMTVFILIRTLYRTVEFATGWYGKVVSTQWLFNVFDGTMITLAMLTLNAFHPGVLRQEMGYPYPSSSNGIPPEDLLKPSDHSEMRAV